MIATIRRSPKKRGRERSGKYFARRISPAQKLRRPIVTLRPCFVHGLVKTESVRRAILMRAAQIRIAGAFMPTGPPKAIGGTYESTFGPILIVLQHDDLLRDFSILPPWLSQFCGNEYDLCRQEAP
jgi:hypothetical protein